ncbi:hypothetical protein [Rufibacter sp. XAAS-G3-1]|uniref:hypothetical protein n=1 Tax=Rufibacter sp. XAAS-G3-1 TaxID=2729134 RepID=UPI0015E70FCE|nr:hypothetical protein [Rufibacter sp. XAAS-G3-1]
MVTLINEILFFDEEEILYKTINETKTLYGIHSSKRRAIIKPTFLHIFPFGRSATKTVAINESDEYIWLDFNGLTHPLDEETKEDYRSTIIKNSRCNCWSLYNIKACGLCDARKQIRNKNGIRLLNKYMGWPS